MRIREPLLVALLCGVLASCYELPDMSRRMFKKADAGCAYQGDIYPNGASIETPEPCLNCTCVRSLLVCYLRICPTVKPPAPGCLAARQPKECCPSFICGEKATSKPDDNVELRPTFQPVTPKPDDSPLYITSDIPDFFTQQDELVNTSKGCLVNGTLYGDGSAMLSESFCEYCFCIKGKTRCIKPKCNLEIKGCTPRYDSHYMCCPTRYHCGQQKTPSAFYSKINKTVSLPTTSSQIITSIAPAGNATTDHYNITESTSLPTTISPVPTETVLGFCVVNLESYEIGESMPDYRPCHSCYCSESGIVCQRIQCSQEINGCEPVIPVGYCCPVSYKCDHNDEGNVKMNHINNSIAHTILKASGIKTDATHLTEFPGKDSSKDLGISRNKELMPMFIDSVPVYRSNDQEQAISIDHTHEDEGSEEIEEEHTITVNVKEMLSLDNYTEIQETETTLVMNTGSESDLSSFYEVTDSDESTVSVSEDFFTNGESSTQKAQNILIGSPEVHTLEITDLLSQLFSQPANQSNKPTEMSFSAERNNSKMPSSILNDLSKSEESESYYLALQNNTGGSETTYTQLITTKSETVKKVSPELSTFAAITSSAAKEAGHNHLLTTPLPLTDHSFKPTNTSYVKNETRVSFNRHSIQVKETTLPFRIISNGQKEVTSTGTNLFKSTTESIRLNSKLSLGSLERDNLKSNNTIKLSGAWKDHVLEAPITDTEGFLGGNRNNESTSNLMSSTSIYEKLFLTTKNTQAYKEEKKTQTEHIQISFTNPTPLQEHEFSTDQEIISSEKQVTQSTTQPIIHEINNSSSSNEAKKSPRIQDQYKKLSTSHDYDIIPFVAQDAIRGHHVKINDTSIHAGGSVPDMISDFCFIKGRIYMNGEMIAKPDPCDLCRCFYGRELCQRQKCPVQPDCQPEKVPGFCCPRFTCAKNMSAESQIKHFPITSSIHTSPMVTPNSRFPDRNTAQGVPVQEKPALKYGIRVRPRPTQLYPPTRSETRQATRVVDFSKITPKPEPSTERTNSVPHFGKDITTKEPDFVHTTFSNTYELVKATYEGPDLLITTLLRNTDASSKPSIRTTTEHTLQFLSDPWGLLKVSGCNIYGKFFKIKDQVEILSGPCSHCICTTNGVECNDIC